MTLECLFVKTWCLMIGSLDLSQFVTKLIFGCPYIFVPSTPFFFFFFFFNVHKYIIIIIIIIIWTCPIYATYFAFVQIFVFVGKWQAHIVFSYLRLLLGKVLWCKRCQLFFFIYIHHVWEAFRVFFFIKKPLKFFKVEYIYGSHGKWVIKPG